MSNKLHIDLSSEQRTFMAGLQHGMQSHLVRQFIEALMHLSRTKGRQAIYSLLEGMSITPKEKTNGHDRRPSRFDNGDDQ